MNVIYMHTHDSGRFWSPYGYPIPTPSLSEFANRASLFRQCYSAAPTCSPSRAALLTGCTPHENGMTGLAHRGWRIKDYSKHIVQYLGSNGFHTVLAGVQHEADSWKEIGYSEVLGVTGKTQTGLDATSTDLKNAEATVKFLNEYNRKKPLFLSVGLINTHREYPKHNKDINPDRISLPYPIPDCYKTRDDMADYYESARIADKCFGLVLEAIEKRGYLEDSIIIITTDHGIAFPRMKGTLYDTGIGVALLISVPDNKLKGESIDAITSHIDLFPTICDYTNLPVPSWCEGKSLRPIFEGKTNKIRSELYAETTYHAAYEPARCIRTERYKFIRRFDYHTKMVMPNIDKSPSKEFMKEAGLDKELYDREELYDLYLDPTENHNLVGDPRYSEIYSELSQKLSDWMKNTSDFFPASAPRAPKPRGSKVNILDAPDPMPNCMLEKEDPSDFTY